ncbi:hypothetical protein [Terriglobus sp. ADX1]|uniref:hypothetical protein n=1 Tax=Terriglobus sp. ADX1 TaxID=2794063 RepID=UPI002FE5DB8A
MPTQFRAGDTVQWSRYVAEYVPSNGWSLSYRFICASGKFDVAATNDGDTFNATIPASTSAGFSPDTYTWVEFVLSENGERHTLRQGACVVLPNLAASAAAADQRTQAQRSLDAIDAVLEGRAGDGVEEYEIHGRRIKKMSVDELVTLRAHFKSIVTQEKVDRGERVQRRRVLTGFGRSC